MDITFKTKKMVRIFNSFKALVKKYGQDRAEKIKIRLDFLGVAKNLGKVPVLPPHRRHELKGNRKGQFAVDLTGKDD